MVPLVDVVRPVKAVALSLKQMEKWYGWCEDDCGLLKLYWEGLKEGGFDGGDVAYCSTLLLLMLLQTEEEGLLLECCRWIFVIDKQGKGAHPTVVVCSPWYYELVEFGCRAIIYLRRKYVGMYHLAVSQKHQAYY